MIVSLQKPSNSRFTNDSLPDVLNSVVGPLMKVLQKKMFQVVVCIFYNGIWYVFTLKENTAFLTIKI